MVEYSGIDFTFIAYAMITQSLVGRPSCKLVVFPGYDSRAACRDKFILQVTTVVVHRLKTRLHNCFMLRFRNYGCTSHSQIIGHS